MRGGMDKIKTGRIGLDRIKTGRVGVAGLGGLGSNIAVMLARMGVGELLLVDYDSVTPGNLDRQHYSVTHLSMRKTDALKAQINEINPDVRARTLDMKITAENAVDVFSGYPIVVEAFDDPVYKADLVGALLSDGKFKVVAASGIAGNASANRVMTSRRFDNLYICGDPESPECGDAEIMSPRVSIVAGHQAHMVARLLMGLDEA